MTARILSFFPDTNLFIQCRSLEELDWSEWADFEEVHLIVCRTVQREIDQQNIAVTAELPNAPARPPPYFGALLKRVTK